MQDEFAAPAPGRYCRLQIMAFVVLNLLGSCVHVPVEPARSVTSISHSAPAQSPQAAHSAPTRS